MIVEIIKRDGCHSTVRMTIEVKGCGSRNNLLFESKRAAKDAVDFIAECVGEKLEHKDECSVVLDETYSILRPGDESYY